MRVLAFRSEALDAGPSIIREVARVDVTAQPASVFGIGKLMSARHGGREQTPRPFAGQRLENAIWNPRPPDILVSADACTAAWLPEGIRRGLPWIVVPAAWRRLRPVVPAVLQEVCWEHVDDGFVPKPSPSRSEREAWCTAMTLRRLLAYATPEELVALST
jgi:hypothetical protein